MSSVIKLEPNKKIKAKFCFEVECCSICKSTFIIIPDSSIRLKYCPYCGCSFYDDSNKIMYNRGISTIVTVLPRNRVSVELLDIDSIETNNTYSVECTHCNESFIIDCGEDKKPKYCPNCGACLSNIEFKLWRMYDFDN